MSGRKIYKFCEDIKGFSKKLTDLMKTKRITTEELAEKLEYSSEYVSSWRCGKRAPELKIIDVLSKIFSISMQELYLPNSIYMPEEENKFSVDLWSSEFLSKENLENFYPKYIEEGLILTENLNLEMLTNFKELILYTDYLLQKMLFSYLNSKEKNILQRVLENLYIFSEYGKKELEMKSEKINYESFDRLINGLLVNKYGRSFKLKIDEDRSRKILYEVNKMIVLSPLNNIPLLQVSLDILLNASKEIIDIYLKYFNPVEINIIYTTLIGTNKKTDYLKSAFKESNAQYISNNIKSLEAKDYMRQLIDEICLLNYDNYRTRLKENK